MSLDSLISSSASNKLDYPSLGVRHAYQQQEAQQRAAAAKADGPGWQASVASSAVSSPPVCGWPGAAARADGIPEYDPCIDLEVATYVNRPEVQAALHVNASGELPGPWADCNPLVKYHR